MFDSSCAGFGNEDRVFDSQTDSGRRRPTAPRPTLPRTRATLETDARNQAAQKAVEKVYLDFPTMVTSYDATSGR